MKKKKRTLFFIRTNNWRVAVMSEGKLRFQPWDIAVEPFMFSSWYECHRCALVAEQLLPDGITTIIAERIM